MEIQLQSLVREQYEPIRLQLLKNGKQHLFNAQNLEFFYKTKVFLFHISPHSPSKKCAKNSLSR